MIMLLIYVNLSELIILEIIISFFYGPYQGEGWPLKSVNSIYNFVLSRPGWICHHDRWGLFVYNNRYPIIINLQASGCAGVLMKDTAINIS